MANGNARQVASGTSPAKKTTAKKTTAKKTVAKQAGAPKKEGYQIYVRVPADRNEESTKRFLSRLAKLLSDEDQNIEVEVFDKYLARAAKKAAARKTAEKIPGGDGGGEQSDDPSPYGGPHSPLHPMYVCHNKN